MSDLTTRLNFLVGKNDAIKETAKINKELDTLRKGLLDVGKTSKTAMSQVANNTASTNRELERAGKNTELLTDRFRNQRDAVGDLSTALGALGSVTSASAGAGALTEGLRFGGDVFGAVEYIPNLADAVKGLGQSATASTGVIGTLATTALSAVPALGGVGAGLLAIGIAAAPFVAIGAGLALVFGELNRQAEEAKKATEQAISRIETEIDVRREIADLIESGNTKALRENAEAAREDLRALIDRKAALEALSKVGGIDAGIIAEDLAQVGKEIDGASLRFSAYNQVLQSADFALAEITSKTNELNAEREKELENLARLETTISQLNAQEAELVTAYQTRQKLQAEDLRLKAQETALLTAAQTIYDVRKTALDELFASEDAKAEQDAQNAELTTKLADIQAQALQKIGDLQAELAKRQLDANIRIADLQEKANEDSAKRLRDFEQRKKQITDKANQDIFDALLGNDVEALDRALREQSAGLRGNRQDFRQDEKEAQKALESRIKQIQDELIAFTTAQNEKIRLEQEALAKRQNAEIEAFNRREALEAQENAKREARAKAYADLEAQLASQRDAVTTFFENRRIELTRQREEQALADQLAKIDIKRQAEVLALDTAIAKVGELQRAINNLQTQKTDVSAAKGAVGTIGTLLTGLIGGGVKPLPKLAEGGITTRPTLALIGERGQEIVMPLSRMNSGRGGRGGAITLNADGMFRGANFGAVLSPDDLNKFAREVEKGFEQFAGQLLEQTQ